MIYLLLPLLVGCVLTAPAESIRIGDLFIAEGVKPVFKCVGIDSNKIYLECSKTGYIADIYKDDFPATHWEKLPWKS